MGKSNRPLRYIEISRRNQVSRILVGTGSSCLRNSIGCGDVCIDIRRAGQYNCNSPIKYNACCQPEPVPLCDLNVAHVCALEIDDDGYAVFEWPNELLNLKEGWYEAHVMSGCSDCGVLPLRVGPRCNVIEVETVVNGPDSLCYVGCEDDCETEICPTNNYNNTSKVYIPDYEV